MADDEPAALRCDPSRPEARHVVPQRPSAGRVDRAHRRRRRAARQLLFSDVDRHHRGRADGRRRPDGRLAGGLALRPRLVGRGDSRRDVAHETARDQRPLVAQRKPGQGRAVRVPGGESIRHRGHPVQRSGRLHDAPVSRGNATQVLDERAGQSRDQPGGRRRILVDPDLLRRYSGLVHIPGAVRRRHDRDGLPDVPLLGNDERPGRKDHAGNPGPAAGAREHRARQGASRDGVRGNGRPSRPRGF